MQRGPERSNIALRAPLVAEVILGNVDDTGASRTVLSR